MNKSEKTDDQEQHADSKKKEEELVKPDLASPVPQKEVAVVKAEIKEEAMPPLQLKELGPSTAEKNKIKVVFKDDPSSTKRKGKRRSTAGEKNAAAPVICSRITGMWLGYKTRQIMATARVVDLIKQHRDLMSFFGEGEGDGQSKKYVTKLRLELIQHFEKLWEN